MVSLLWKLSPATYELIRNPFVRFARSFGISVSKISRAKSPPARAGRFDAHRRGTRTAGPRRAWSHPRRSARRPQPLASLPRSEGGPLLPEAGRSALPPGLALTRGDATACPSAGWRWRGQHQSAARLYPPPIRRSTILRRLDAARQWCAGRGNS